MYILIRDIDNNANYRGPRGEIGRHKGLKRQGIELKVSP
jgi:hypothetical protein